MRSTYPDYLKNRKQLTPCRTVPAKLTLLITPISSSYKLALPIHQDTGLSISGQQ